MLESIWRWTGKTWKRLGKYQLPPYSRFVGICANIAQGLVWAIWATIDHWHFDGVISPFYEWSRKDDG